MQLLALCTYGYSSLLYVYNIFSENEILREGNVSLEILRDRLKTRVSDLEEEMRKLRDDLEQSLSNKDNKNADDEVMTMLVLVLVFFWCQSSYITFHFWFVALELSF